MPHPVATVLTLALLVAGCTAVPSAAPPPATAAAPAEAPDPPVNASAMNAAATIAANVAAAPNLTVASRAVQGSGRAATLAAAGSYTFLAPTDAAFGRLAPGSVDALLQPANRASLAGLIDFHIIPGTLTLADLRARVTAGGGSASLPTLSGESLVATLQGNTVALADSAGNKSYVEVADLRQANGMIQIVNGVLVPKPLR